MTAAQHAVALIWTMAVLSFGSSIGFAIAGEYKRAAYWFCVTLLDIVLAI